MEKKYDYKVKMSKYGEVRLYNLKNMNFGWGDAVYRDAYAKLNYLACMAFECHNQLMYKVGRERITQLDEILNLKDMKKLFTVMKKNVKGFTGFSINSQDISRFRTEPYRLYLNNSIDHQSWEDYKNIDEFLSRYKITLENFLFNPYVTLIIGNDNEPFGYEYF